MLQESFRLILSEKTDILQSKIWLPWKHQVTWTVNYRIKFLPNNLKKIVTKFGSVFFNIKKS